MQTERLSRGEITIQKTVFTSDTGVHKVHLLLFGISDPREALAICDEIAEEEQTPVVFQRFFVSDIDQQEPLIRSVLKAAGNTTPTSIIGQKPADGSPMALWAYLSDEPKEMWFTSLGREPDVAPGVPGVLPDMLSGSREYKDLQSANNRSQPGRETLAAFSDLIARLKANGLTLADHCQRTWLFIDDIDHNYADVVRARNDVFDREGLTTDTHFIASTGIAGKPYQKEVKVDAVVYPDVPKENISYLYAPDNMNRTSEYGVRFERGTVVRLKDYTQVFISGTASINNRGEVVHKGDVIKQAERMMKNIKALLAEAHCTTDDIQQAIVYLRHREDYKAVDQWFAEYYPTIPHIIVHAPVCRPDWLIETECMAMHIANC